MSSELCLQILCLIEVAQNLWTVRKRAEKFCLSFFANSSIGRGKLNIARNSGICCKLLLQVWNSYIYTRLGWCRYRIISFITLSV